MISDSEMEDFEAAILEAGFEVDDFNVIPLEDEPIDIEQYFLTGTEKRTMVLAYLTLEFTSAVCEKNVSETASFRAGF